jgi:hypothetical protein
MAGPGQECWNHGCNLCCWIQTLPDGTKSEHQLRFVTFFSTVIFHSNQ